jgi:hypothetical protein
VRNMKKFEEGVFSDLRNLKPGVDACLEDPKVSHSNNFCAELGGCGGREKRGGQHATFSKPVCGCLNDMITSFPRKKALPPFVMRE